MWAQLIKARVKPEAMDGASGILEEVRSRIRQRPGLVRQIVMENQRDPEEIYTLLVFENEEVAREGERSPEQQEFAKRLASLNLGQPEFVDLNVIAESTP